MWSNARPQPPGRSRQAHLPLWSRNRQALTMTL